MGGMSNAYNILVGKPERKRLLRRLRRSWEDDTKIYLKLQFGKVASSCEHGNEPSGSIKREAFLD
jgi:hypothetical protein